jgi:hypothetical protein
MCACVCLRGSICFYVRGGKGGRYKCIKRESVMNKRTLCVDALLYMCERVG